MTRAGRALDPAIVLSIAVGSALIGRPTEAERARLQAAIDAVPADGTAAAALAKVARAWLAGEVEDRALRASLAVFNAPYCRGGVPAFTPSTHAARVADAMEDDRVRSTD